MKELTAIVHEGGYWGTCLEVPGANGQSETREECLKDLASAVELILQINREEVFRDDPNAQEIALLVS